MKSSEPRHDIAMETRMNRLTRLVRWISLYVCILATSGMAAAEPSPSGLITSPQDGQLALRDDTGLTLRLSAQVDPRSISNRSITLIGPQGAQEIRVRPGASDNTVIIEPIHSLSPGSNFSLFVKGAQQKDGEQVPLQTISFATASLAPTTQALSPAPGANDCDNDRTMNGHTFCHSGGKVEEGVFTPGFSNTGGRWRTNIPLPHVLSLADVSTRIQSGSTSVFGRVLRIDDSPVAGVSISIDGKTTRTDTGGVFILTGITPGHVLVDIDGSTASTRDTEYGSFQAAVDVVAKTANAVPYNLYIPRVVSTDVVTIDSPTAAEVTIRHPLIPGFALHLPAGSVIRDRRGRVLTRIAVVPMPVDRSPIPVPDNFPVYVSMQPGGATVEVLGDSKSRGISVTYPNYTDSKSNDFGFWNYDAYGRGWNTYTVAHLSVDASSVVADSIIGAEVFMPLGGPSTGGKARPGRPTLPCGEQRGDPVDCATGDFLHHSVDLSIDDVMPAQLSRTYNSSDTQLRQFGRGANSEFGMYLYAPESTCFDTLGAGNELDVIGGDGAVYPFLLPSGNVIAGQMLYHTASPSKFYGATLRVGAHSGTFIVELRDGTQYSFSDSCPSELLSISNRFGSTLTLSYVAGLLTQVSTPNGRSLSFAYNANNFVSSVTDSSGRSVTYNYTGNNLTTVTYPDNTTEKYTYDANNNMLNVTDRNNNVAVMNQYDANSRVQLQTYPDSHTMGFGYTLSGTAVTATDITDERGYVEHLAFDGAGYVLTRTLATGTSLAQTTSYTRGQNELITSETDALNRTTTTQYDTWGDVVNRTFLSGTAQAVTYSFSYTPAYHQLSSITDPLGHTTTFGFGDFDCLTAATDPLSHAYTITCNGDGQPLSVSDALNHTETLSYESGLPVALTDALNRTSYATRDALGRVVASSDALGRTRRRSLDSNDHLSQTIDPLSHVAHFQHDNNGNLTDVIDPNTGHTHYGYDARNRRTSRIDAIGQQESWTYDGKGNVLTYTDRKNQVTNYQYDALNRLSLITFADGSTITPTFDAGDRLTSVVDSNSGTINRTYDGLDRLTQEQTSQGTVNYTYDSAGRRATMTPFSQTQIVYTFDSADRLTNIVQGSQAVTIGYDNANRRTSLTLPNGVVTTYGYDAADELTSLTYKNSTGSVLGTISYTYDNAGQRITQSGGFGMEFLATPTTGMNTFDLNNRETLWDGFVLGYDPNGDPTSNSSTSPAKTYTFDARHQLSSISQGGGIGTTSYFYYDALGRRTSKLVSGRTTQYLYEGLNIVQETQGSTTSLILTGLGIDERYSRTEAAGPRYFLTDAIGSSVALTDAGQTVQATYSYEPYGEVTATGSSTNPYQYTGRENDGTGLYFYRARYYSPGLKRFISEDPAGFLGGLNGYAYVDGDPIDLSDPLGLWWFGDSLPDWLIDYSTGLGDSLTLNATYYIREHEGWNDVVNKCSGWYRGGSWTAFAFGAGRLGYAAAAKGYSMFAASGAAASAGRSALRAAFGGGESLRPPNLSKYLTDDELRWAAGRTNKWFNLYATGVVVTGAWNGSGCGCDQ